MKKAERQRQILEILESQSSVGVGELSSLFSVSEMSIRSDLNYLAEKGMLNRIYGGANSKRNFSIEMEAPLTEKRRKNKDKKEAIGREAAKLVEDGDSVMIEAGTTTNEVALFLLKKKQLTVITNGINIINAMISARTISLYTIGGQVNARSYSIVGSAAERDLEGYNATVCILGTDALDLDRGLMNNSSEAASIARVMLRRSNRRILVCDSSKIGHAALIQVCGIEGLDTIVTDSEAPERFVQSLRERGLQVIVAVAENRERDAVGTAEEHRPKRPIPDEGDH